MTTAAQIRAIHTLKTRTGLADDDYRALLSRYGKASSKDLSDGAAGDLLEELRRLPGASAVRASGRYAPILQALWISAFNLGLVRSVDDRAMMKFVERQTGLTHVRFLRNSDDATRAIEGLKSWMRREAKVEWPQTVNEHHRKRAVVEAIARRLGALEQQPLSWPDGYLEYGQALGLPVTFEVYGAADWDKLSNKLGTRLRGLLAKGARHG